MGVLQGKGKKQRQEGNGLTRDDARKVLWTFEIPSRIRALLFRLYLPRNELCCGSPMLVVMTITADSIAPFGQSRDDTQVLGCGIGSLRYVIGTTGWLAR